MSVCVWVDVCDCERLCVQRKEDGVLSSALVGCSTRPEHSNNSLTARFNYLTPKPDSCLVDINRRKNAHLGVLFAHHLASDLDFLLARSGRPTKSTRTLAQPSVAVPTFAPNRPPHRHLSTHSQVVFVQLVVLSCNNLDAAQHA